MLAAVLAQAVPHTIHYLLRSDGIALYDSAIEVISEHTVQEVGIIGTAFEEELHDSGYYSSVSGAFSTGASSSVTTGAAKMPLASILRMKATAKAGSSFSQRSSKNWWLLSNAPP